MVTILYFTPSVEDDAQEAVRALEELMNELVERVDKLAEKYPSIRRSHPILLASKEEWKERNPKVYWFEEKGILKFDAGWTNGAIYIYKEKEEKEANELEEQLQKYGHHRDWSLFEPNIHFKASDNK